MAILTNDILHVVSWSFKWKYSGLIIIGRPSDRHQMSLCNLNAISSIPALPDFLKERETCCCPF